MGGRRPPPDGYRRRPGVKQHRALRGFLLALAIVWFVAGAWHTVTTFFSVGVLALIYGFAEEGDDFLPIGLAIGFSAAAVLWYAAGSTLILIARSVIGKTVGERDAAAEAAGWRPPGYPGGGPPWPATAPGGDGTTATAPRSEYPPTGKERR